MTGIYAVCRSRRLRYGTWLPAWNRCGLLLVQVFNADLQRPQKLQLLSSDLQFHFPALESAGGCLLAVGFGAFVETDRGFQDEKHIITRISNVLNGFADVSRLGESVIYGGA